MKWSIWTLGGEQEGDWRKPNPARRLAYIAELQSLLLAGTAGAFFFALASKIPLHLKEASWHPDCAYTIDRFLRYGYLLWLLTYFFVSSVNNDQQKESRTWQDISFDVGQTLFSITSVILLGFIVPDLQYYLAAYVMTNVTIFLICIVSRWWFGRGAKDVNNLRLAGAGVSFLSLLMLAAGGARSKSVLVFLTVCQLILWFFLIAFIRVRVDARAIDEVLVEIISEPSRASIRVDDELRGRTPAVIGVSVASSQVIIEKNDYIPSMNTLPIPGGKKEIDAKLQKK